MGLSELFLKEDVKFLAGLRAPFQQSFNIYTIHNNNKEVISSFIDYDTFN